MAKKIADASEIRADIKDIINETVAVEFADTAAEGKIFNLSELRARLFKANYTPREINATMASLGKRGLMKIIADKEEEGNYIFGRKVYA
jgi:hypothetical protein